LGEILIVDVSKYRHIVDAYNVKTVQQKYTKGKNEEEIGSPTKKKRRKT